MCRCAAPQPARERKRPHSLLTAWVCWGGFRFPPSQSPKLTVADKHSLTRFGNPSRSCLAGGFFGCRSPGIRQGNCASLGPLPSGLSGEAEVWPRSPGEQAPKPPNNELAVPANQQPSSAAIAPAHSHAHSHRDDSRETADSEMDCVAPCSQIMGGFSGLPEHVPLAPELWDHSGITRTTLITLGSRSAEPYLGSWRRSTRLNPATSSWLARLGRLASR
jgi:hypothetical protein